MGRTFRGEGVYKVDSKGRVSIPAKFLRVLEACDPNWDPDSKDHANPELVIVYGDHRRKYLECFTIEAMDEVDAQIRDLPRGSPKRKVLQTLFNGQSYETSVDDTGRLVLPAKLRRKIGIESEAFFIAQGDTFQIWNPQTYEEVALAQTEAFLDELPEDFDPLQLLDDEAGGA